jgi:hypothetical protein
VGELGGGNYGVCVAALDISDLFSFSGGGVV